jgi:hypothetical protein
MHRASSGFLLPQMGLLRGPSETPNARGPWCVSDRARAGSGGTTPDPRCELELGPGRRRSSVTRDHTPTTAPEAASGAASERDRQRPEFATRTSHARCLAPRPLLPRRREPTREEIRSSRGVRSAPGRRDTSWRRRAVMHQARATGGSAASTRCPGGIELYLQSS